MESLVVSPRSVIPAPGRSQDRRGIAISRMSRGDIPTVISLLKPIPEVCYCEWENVDLLRPHLERDNRYFNFSAHTDEGVVGALIGGSLGVRGTVSHLAVASGWRRCGVGRALVEHCLGAFARSGIKRVFVFTEDTNRLGTGLWSCMGFRPTGGETTWERDL